MINARFVLSGMILTWVMMTPGAFAKMKDSNLADLTVRGLQYAIEGNAGTFRFRVANIGRGNTKAGFAIALFLDSKPFTHVYYDVTDGSSSKILPITPLKSFKTSMGDDPSFRTGRHIIKICADKFLRSAQKQDSLRDGFRNNMIWEYNESNNCETMILEGGIVQLK